ncbi:caspase family protein [Azomonas macrocytogenes]|uniref:Peptidase C14 caspase domain-containing protein n=1 Tax=Azomonas macrocytogenes TaxID=69962 RepID=A0A839T6Y7_AZOMA|nr:caspase family protein [Azomonas macrocytogenes]MBB3104216.1 hypothetical protein [Azomonas macrocytogenes]
MAELTLGKKITRIGHGTVAQAVAIGVAALIAIVSSSAQAETLTVPPIPALSTLPPWAQVQTQPVKRALVIGIHEYQYAAKLPTPAFDEELVVTALQNLDPNFVITRVSPEQMTRAGLLKAIEDFTKSLNTGESAFVFFSGHGLESQGVNYLLAADAQPAEAGQEGTAYISVPYLIERIQNTGAAMTAIILDACHVDPFASYDADSDILDASAADRPGQARPDHSAAAGLSRMTTPQGFLVAYAAEPGKASYSLFRDDSPDQGSIFTRRFVSHLATLNRPIQTILTLTAGDVSSLTGGRQKPFVNASSIGEMRLHRSARVEQDELESWTRTVADSPTDQQFFGLREFVSLYPASHFSSAARSRMASLKRSNAPSVFAQTDQAEPLNVGILFGALQTPGLVNTLSNVAFAGHDVFVRERPYANTPKVIASLWQGDEVRVLDGSVRPGWAKIVLENGTVGYVGSVNEQPLQKPETTSVLELVGDETLNELQVHSIRPWNAMQLDSATALIKVGPVADKDPRKARQTAYLRALRLRAALVAQGVSNKRIIMILEKDKDRSSSDSASVTLLH